MADDVRKLDFKPGDVLAAEDLQTIARAIQGPSFRFAGGGGIHGEQASDGSLSLSVPQRAKYVAVADSTITARSGTTLGTGTATAYVNLDGTATATTLGVPIYNASTVPVPSGAYFVAEEMSDGYWYAGALTTPDLWCQLSGSLGPATGSWSGITATTTTADVYMGSGTALALVASGATIYNRRNVTWAASKACYLVPSGSGYAIVDQDC